MRYVAAAALHQKALKSLAAIEKAEERMKEKRKEIRLFGIVFNNWREELSIFPLGKPPAAEQERTKHEFEITKAAHKRLCAYYSRILSCLIDLQNF